MGLDTDAYLRRLRITDPGPPSVAALRALHTAHTERVAYEALDIQLGRITSIDPADSVERIAHRGRGGYCYHLNGAFSLLLEALGYHVVRHRAGVQNPRDPGPPGAAVANHLALTVHGLPDSDSPSGDWLVDAGLGDALHGPLPLREGTYEEGPFSFRLRPSEVEPGGWRLDHDPQGSFAGMDFEARAAAIEEFADRHLFLSTSPESGFVRVCAVQRRDAGGVDALTGLALRRIATTRTTEIIEGRADWFAALADVFSLPLTDLDAAARENLWTRVYDAHLAWVNS